MTSNEATIVSIVWPAEEPNIPPPPEEEPQGRHEKGGKPTLVVSPTSIENSPCAQVSRRPREVAAVVRYLMHTQERIAGPLAHLSSQQVAAAFMIGVGREIGALVLKHLDDAELDPLIQSIATMPQIDHQSAMHALAEVCRRLETGEYMEIGGVTYARQLLEAAGRWWQTGQSLGRAERTANSSNGEEEHPLRKAAPQQIAPFISHEHPQTIALFLSQCRPSQAAGILAQLPERLQAEVAYRIATMESTAADAIQQIEEALESSLHPILESGTQDRGGPKVVADILNQTGSSVEKNVLDQMDVADSEVAELVRTLMFTFADIIKLTDREIQTLLRQVDQKDLVIALKGASEELRQRILRNMSKRVRIFITEEMEFLGPMRLSEVEEVQLRILRQVRQLEEQGQITIVRGFAEDTFV